MFLRRWWRRLTFHCELCNDRIYRPLFNDLYYRYPSRWLCRWCNKRMMFAVSFGRMSRTRFWKEEMR